MKEDQVPNQNHPSKVYASAHVDISQAAPAAGEYKLNTVDVDSPVCVGELPGLHVLGFFALVLNTHRALFVEKIYPKIKPRADRVPFAEAMLLAESVVNLRLEAEDPARLSIRSKIPHHVCMPGLAQLKTYEFADALETIAFQLYRHFAAIAAAARAVSDPYEAAQLAQALHFAFCVHDQSAMDADCQDNGAEAFLVEQFARWSDHWAADPAGENIDTQLRYMNRGQTIAHIHAATGATARGEIITVKEAKRAAARGQRARR